MPPRESDVSDLPPAHDHGHEPAKPSVPTTQQPGLDTAQQSLSDALGVSFAVLKGLLVVLIVVYLASGVFQVDEQNEAVRLRFGERIGTYKPGWHFGLPYPLEEVVHIPVNEQRLILDQSFWYNDPEGNSNPAALAMQPLDPLKDGFLITGDANVVHIKFVVLYKVSDVEMYIENVGDTERAEEIVQMAAERGIVVAMASSDARQIIERRYQVEIDQAKTLAEEILADLNTGLTIQQVQVTDPSPPVQIQASAYQLVSAAEQDRGTAIQNARQTAVTTLNDVAGAAHPDLTALIRAYEAAGGANDTDLADALRGEIDQSITTLQMFGQRVDEPVALYLAAMTRIADDDVSEQDIQAMRDDAAGELHASLTLAAQAPREARSGRTIGGTVDSEIKSARAYQTRVISRIQSDYKHFIAYRAAFARQPLLIAHEIWQESRTRALANALSPQIITPTDNLRIETDGDPLVIQEVVEDLLNRRREEIRDQQQSGR